MDKYVSKLRDEKSAYVCIGPNCNAHAQQLHLRDGMDVCGHNVHPIDCLGLCSSKGAAVRKFPDGDYATITGNHELDDFLRNGDLECKRQVPDIHILLRFCIDSCLNTSILRQRSSLSFEDQSGETRCVDMGGHDSGLTLFRSFCVDNDIDQVEALNAQAGVELGGIPVQFEMGGCFGYCGGPHGVMPNYDIRLNGADADVQDGFCTLLTSLKPLSDFPKATSHFQFKDYSEMKGVLSAIGNWCKNNDIR